MHYDRVQRKENYGAFLEVAHSYNNTPYVYLPFIPFFQLDCGIHPGLSGIDALPFVDLIEADEIDLLLISQ